MLPPLADTGWVVKLAIPEFLFVYLMLIILFICFILFYAYGQKYRYWHLLY